MNWNVAFRPLLPLAALAAAAHPGWARAPQIDPCGVAANDAPYASLTDDLEEFTNFMPEPFSGIAFDSFQRIYAVNPYNNSWLRYPRPLSTTNWPTTHHLRTFTGHNPVSIGVWEPGALADLRVLVVCGGSNALFVHNNAGDVVGVLPLHSEPSDLLIDSANARAFVSCRGRNTVMQLDLTAGDVPAVEKVYTIPCGQRPGPMCLDASGRVYVAAMVTGNQTRMELPTNPVTGLGKVISEPGLPDQDVFLLDPDPAPNDPDVIPVVRGAGSLLFDVGLPSATGALWILATDSLNDQAIQTEPAFKGSFATNRLALVEDTVGGPPVTLTNAANFVDLDDTDPNTAGGQYSSSASVNQARTIAFRAVGQSYEAFVASPMSRVIARLDATGARTFTDYTLPLDAQCYALAVHPTKGNLVALCLGTMTLEVFDTGQAHSLSIGEDPTPATIKEGRRIMLDGSRSLEGRFTCFSCHEGGRTDQLGWGLSDPPKDFKDVMVTQSLLSIRDTFPHHWRGERDLGDFRGAFEALLGAVPADPEVGAVSVEEMAKVEAFMRSLRAPANPWQSLDRNVCEAAGSDGFYLKGVWESLRDPAFSAVEGQDKFLEQKVPFNRARCADCHSVPTGSSDNLFETPHVAPRIRSIEVAHLRQLQHKGLDTVLLGTTEVNRDGFGALHNGGDHPSVFEFITQFNDFKPKTIDGEDLGLEEDERKSVFRFVEQFDQGIAPAAHYATWLDENSPVDVIDRIEDVLIASAEAGWIDLVAFGTFTGVPAGQGRWLYDATSHEFHTAFGHTADWQDFLDASDLGDAANAFLGVPLGNGYRIAFDPDMDDYVGTEDTDTWVAAVPPKNLAGRAQVSSVTAEFVSARVAKFHVEFSEDVTYVVESDSGGPDFVQPDFVQRDTFVLTHSSPSVVDPMEKTSTTPEPGTLPFGFTIRATDREGNQCIYDGIWTPLAGSVQEAVEVDGTGTILNINDTRFLHVKSIEIVPDADPQYVLVTIKVASHSGEGDLDDRRVLCTLNRLGPTGATNEETFIVTGATGPAPWLIDNDGSLAFFQSLPGIAKHQVPFTTLMAQDEFIITEPLTPMTGYSQTSFRIDKNAFALAQGEQMQVCVQGVVRGQFVSGYFAAEALSLFDMQLLLNDEPGDPQQAVYPANP